MAITKTPKIWMNGELIDWDDANIHLLTHTLHYGMGVFEGVRAYETDRGPGVFRLTEHMERLHRSAHMLMMEIPYSVQQLVDATKDVIREAGVTSCYIRPIAYLGYGEMGLNPLTSVVDTAIAVWPWGAYLGDDGIKHGIRAKISGWRRHDANSIPPACKCTGMYVNSSLAKVEAIKAGYDEALLLSQQGTVSEGTGENLFVVRGDVLTTPPTASGALEGITRDTIMTIARERGYEVVEANVLRSDLYIADEAFLTGTAAEVVPLRSVDDREIGEPGPITKELQDAYYKAVRGELEGHKEWCEFVN